jgi:hypothetical protein
MTGYSRDEYVPVNVADKTEPPVKGRQRQQQGTEVFMPNDLCVAVALDRSLESAIGLAHIVQNAGSNGIALERSVAIRLQSEEA